MNKRELSTRLHSVAESVRSQGVVADVGCDHGFTSIYLVRNHLAERVIAMDIGVGPLSRATQHIIEAGLTNQIETRLSDGLTALEPGEVDTILISGMGGGLMTKILSDGAEVVRSAKEFVLSPQSEPYLVRRYLCSQGLEIDREQMLVDQGKYYLVIHAVKPQTESASGADFLDDTQASRSAGDYTIEEIYGTYLLEKKDKILYEYLDKELRRVENILAGMISKPLSESARQRWGLLLKEKEQILEAIDRCVS